MNRVLLNLLFFKVAWVTCVASAAAGAPIAGVAAVAAAAGYHVLRAKNPRAEILLLAFAALIGLAWETALVSVGVLDYGDSFAGSNIAPYWIVAMWVLFATTLNVGMRWLKKSTVIAIVAGAIGGPLSFLAGEKAGAVNFADPIMSLVVIGAGWAVLLPLLARIAKRFDGHALESARTG